MFKKPSKRVFLIRRILLSVLATISVLIIVTLSILFMLGYRLDSNNGHLEQGALLQFDSKPNGADVWVDGKSIGSQTATKQTVLAGVHTISMSKTGYNDWTRTLKLSAGTLTWLDYTRLVPKSLPVESIAGYKTLAGLTFSPDLKWALALEDASIPTFHLIDLRSESVKSSDLTLPTSLYTTVPNTASAFTMYRWNSGGRYILVQHTYGNNQTEWLMVDTQDLTKSVNITRTLNVGFTDLQFTGTGGTSLYGLTTDKDVRKVDLSANTISRPFITNVMSFSVFEDTNTLTYIGLNPTDTTKKVAGLYKDGQDSPVILQTAQNVNNPLAIALGRYFGDDYVAIAENTHVTILTGSLPNSGDASPTGLRKYGTLQLQSPITALSFSDKGDYVLAQSSGEFMSFETEYRRTASGTVTPAEGKPATNLKWLDTAHLWNDDTNSLIMRDFDGSNAHTIMPVVSGFGASLSSNGTFFYGVGKTDTGYQLQRVRMILK